MNIRQQQGTDVIEHVFRAWDDALGAKDLDASMALYQPDATLESPLVRHLLGIEEGIVRGRENLRAFVARVFAKEQPQRRRFRTGFLSDGSRFVGLSVGGEHAGERVVGQRLGARVLLRLPRERARARRPSRQPLRAAGRCRTPSRGSGRNPG